LCYDGASAAWTPLPRYHLFEETVLASASFRCSIQILSLNLLALFFFIFCPQPTFAATPPIDENAYCAKGDVPKFGDKDGPAALPTTCYYTALDGTPSPGKEIHVNAGSTLSSSMESVNCGDTVLLPAGASFQIKQFPAKNCDEGHYITVKTDTPDSELPPEHTRISPAWAGVASLPGRPDYAQPRGGAAKRMATLVIKEPNGAKVGDHYRFIGIEWTSEGNTRVSRLVTTEGANHVIFDRNWFHPAEGAEMAKGVMLIHGTQSIAVINSYLSGFNCVAGAGACTDSSAIGGGNGQEGDINKTFKIYNNFAEASGQCIFFGGAVSDVNPEDIEIRRNHLFRPMTWKEGEPGYAPSPLGHPYIVKNNFELKSAIRVFFEANLLENTWGGFSQTGFAILLTPKNQMARCPRCAVLDVTLRYNRVRNVAGVIQIATAPDKNGAPAADGGRYSIHDLVADSIHAQDWKGFGAFGLVISNAPLIHDLSFNHITAVVPGSIFMIKTNNGEKISNFVVTNNLFIAGGQRPEISAAGRAIDCPGPPVQRAGPEAIFKECFANYSFQKNLIVSHTGGWPKGNITTKSADDAGIGKPEGRAAVRLCRKNTPGCNKNSPALAAASDGRDLGADEDAVAAAIAGID
jgi:hypothetical protein